MCSYEKQVISPRWDLIWFCRDLNLGKMKIFHTDTRKWASPARRDGVFFNQLCFVFQMLIKQCRNICSTWWLYVTFYCKNYSIKQSFFSGITNFLIEPRLKIPYERGKKVISPRRGSPSNRASSPSYEHPKNTSLFTS